MSPTASPDSAARRATQTGASLFALGLIAGCGQGSQPRTVLLISLDTLRADAGLFEDQEVAPELFALAERGTRFNQASSGTSWTLPSHAQMFTGQSPPLHGVEDDNLRLDALTPTLPERFSDAGWRTFGTFTGWYLLGDFGFSRGFEVYQNSMPAGDELERALASDLDRGRGKEALLKWQAADHQSHLAITSPIVADFATSALAESTDQDLFLFLHLFDPHYDYVPPPPFDTRFDPEYQGKIDGRNFYLNERVWKDGVRTISDRDLDHIRALYLGEIAWTDENLGRVLDRLDASGRSEELTIAVVSDHGEEFFEHGRVGHRHTLYEEVVRIPFLLVPSPSAGWTPPSSSELPISLSDLAPTLLELAGLDPLPAASGQSLVPLLRGESLPASPQIGSVRFRPMVTQVESENQARQRFRECYRTRSEKLVREYWVRDGERRLASLEWYDLSADPLEQQPSVDPSDARIAAAWEAMENEYGRLRALHQGAPHSPDSARDSRARELFASQLEGLGYIQPSGGNSTLEADRLPWGIAPPPAWPFEAALKSRR
jgi:arylsulfatase A-like enzyme